MNGQPPEKPAKRPRGRPYSGGRAPMRSIRVSDRLWALGRKASARAGMTLNAWLRVTLAQAASRQLQLPPVKDDESKDKTANS